MITDQVAIDTVINEINQELNDKREKFEALSSSPQELETHHAFPTLFKNAPGF